MTLAAKGSGTVKNWWWFIVKGILFVIAGISVLLRPVEGYPGLSFLFSIVMLGTGACQLTFASSNRSWLPGWGWTMVAGGIDVLTGFYLLMFPVVTMVTLPFFISFWLMFRSFYIMGISIDLNNLQVSEWGWFFGGGLVLMILSFLILFYPAGDMVGIVAYTGSAFLTGGVLAIVMALTFREIKL